MENKNEGAGNKGVDPSVQPQDKTPDSGGGGMVEESNSDKQITQSNRDTVESSVKQDDSGSAEEAAASPAESEPTAESKPDSDSEVRIERREAKKKVVPVKVAGDEKYIVTSSPHVFGKASVSRIMWTVNACLAPAGIAGIYIFGFSAFWVILSCLAGAVLSEYLWQKLNKKPITIKDGSAFLTGLLLAYNLPPGIPLWAAFLGSAFAIIIVKHLFGGLGNNIFNPALAARGFLLMSWPEAMTTWWKPFHYKIETDAITTATPLAMMKSGHLQEFLDSFPTVGKMFSAFLWGGRSGCLGETCSILLILGGLYLIYKKYIDWQIPVTYMATVGVLSLVFYNIGMKSPMDPFSTLTFSLFSGGLVLGAFYMATDYVTCPATLKGRIIFALGCGILTAIIRRWGGLPEGVCYSILIMNALVPFIDSKIRTTVYGTGKEKEEK